jgi:hypothetical protein
VESKDILPFSKRHPTVFMKLIYRYITIQQPTTDPKAGSDEYSPHSHAFFLLDKNIPLLRLGLSNELLPSSYFT